MNWSQREAWDKMLTLLKESHNSPPQVRQNKLLEAIVYGVGVIICKEERYDKRKTRSNTKSSKNKRMEENTTT